jgi:DNA-3-methyladenine glycosylase
MPVSLAEYPPASPDYFRTDARHLARALIGAFLVHESESGTFVLRVVETEAYRGPTDAASHARFGRTARTRTLLGPPGRAYVFLVYGVHDCFNVVCHEAGKGHAVLIRAGTLLLPAGTGQRCNGPGLLTKAMGISREHDGMDLIASRLYVSPRRAGTRVKVLTSARIGVAYAGEMAERPWRFFDAKSPDVSRPPASAIGLGARAKPRPRT